MSVLPACEGIRAPGPGATDSCELLCQCWELNLGLLEERPVRLTLEPALYPFYFLRFVFFVVAERGQEEQGYVRM